MKQTGAILVGIGVAQVMMRRAWLPSMLLIVGFGLLFYF